MIDMDKGNTSVSYRTSHAKSGYGKHYAMTYKDGYYAYQWQQIEKPLLDDLFTAISEGGNKKYLDFACGTGRILGVGEQYFQNSTGVDISAEMLAVAEKNCQTSKLIQQDITKQPLKYKYDIVTAFRFFLNAEDELTDDVLRTLHSFLLVDDGILLLNIHVNANSPLGLFYKTRNAIQGKNSANTKTYRDMEVILLKNGFIIEKVYWYSFLPRTGWYFNWVSKYLMVPVETVFKKVPFLRFFAQCFLIQCRKR